MNIPVSGVVPIEQMVGDDATDTALLQQMCVDTKNYLETFDWCDSAGPAYWGGGVGKIFSIFLFQIEPRAVHIDRWLWVIVGDIPGLYLVPDECRSPKTDRGHVPRVNGRMGGACAAGLIRRIGKPEDAERFEAMSPEQYPAHKHAVTAIPFRRYGIMAQ